MITTTSQTLADANIGENVIVSKINVSGELKRRIMDMGITKGASISINKFAPLGDPMEIAVRGYRLTLRKQDARKIICLCLK